MRSHRMAVVSLLAVANVRSSGENATEWPVRGDPRRRGWVGSVRSHRMTVASKLAVARMRPSEENATDSTEPVWPVSVPA